jgi:hypothetical protein
VKPSASTLGTDGGGAVGCSTLGAGAVAGAAELKMVASCWSASLCSLDSGLSGEAAWGLFKAWIRSWAAAVAALADEVLGRGTVVGNQTSVLVVRSLLVSTTQTL